MKIDDIDIAELTAFVRDTADAELMPRFRRVSATAKADGSLLTEADLAMQQSLTDCLSRRWPDIRLLGEEMDAGQQQALLADAGKRLWVLDPLDGTSNFAAGLPLFGVSLALVQQGRVVLGLVYDPVARECFSAIEGQGAWLNGEPLRLACSRSTLSDCVALVDFKRLPDPLAARLACEPPYRSQRSLGSVALDWCWLAAGRLQLYLHGAQRLWDYGAGALVFREAGGLGGQLDELTGQWQTGLSLQPRIGLAAGNATLLEAWRDWIAGSLSC
jgi:myo-inositol-1(or 4)-monophosphatase